MYTYGPDICIPVSIHLASVSLYLYTWYLYPCLYGPDICIPVSILLVSVSLYTPGIWYLWFWYLHPCIYTPGICIAVSILLVSVPLYPPGICIPVSMVLVSVSLYYDLSKAFDSLISGLGVIHSHNIYIIIFYYHHSYFKLAERDCSLILSKP